LIKHSKTVVKKHELKTLKSEISYSQCDRAVKFAQNIHGESSRRANREQSLIAERNQLKVELTKMKEYTSHLENV
jgi:hypothetical protein